MLMALSPVLYPWFALDLWYLWAISLSVPLAVMALPGFARILLRLQGIARVGPLLVLLIVAPYVMLNFGFMVLPPQKPFPYFSNSPFLAYSPSSMLSNTIPVEDSLDSLKLLRSLNQTMSEDSVLVVHEAFHGFATLSITGEKTIINYHVGDVLSAVAFARQAGFVKIFWIWWLPGYGWHGLPNPPTGFSITLESGRMAVYAYTP